MITVQDAFSTLYASTTGIEPSQIIAFSTSTVFTFTYAIFSFIDENALLLIGALVILAPLVLAAGALGFGSRYYS